VNPTRTRSLWSVAARSTDAAMLANIRIAILAAVAAASAQAASVAAGAPLCGDTCQASQEAQVVEAGSDSASFMQFKSRGQRQASAGQICQQGASVQCPGSSDMCEGNQCCPGIGASNNGTFPCPSADPTWNQCESSYTDSCLVETPGPYEFIPDGPCSGPGTLCESPGWVYCQDAECSEPTVVDGVLVAKCLCWAPKNTNTSILPDGENAGASCVINKQRTGAPLPAGGKAMCDAIKEGSLISTWGPKGWKPPLVTSKCQAGTPFAWCWGAPCKREAGDIVCDCPMVSVNSDATQYLSLSSKACAEEADPCTMTHNGDPAGSATKLHEHMAQCSANPDPCVPTP